MYLSLLSMISNLYFVIGFSSYIRLINYNNSIVNLSQNAVVSINKNRQIRDELDLQQKAIAQGYVLQTAQIDPRDDEQKTYIYDVFQKNTHTLKLENICQSDRQGISKAMLLSGYWSDTGEHIDDSSVVTVACTSGVLAKCVRMGYKPWKEFAGVPLRDYHQACTRMMRADYCGNGNSHTQDGRQIDVYDSLKIQQPEKNTGLAFEAAWGKDGAIILDRTRYPDTIERLKQKCPEKLKQIYSTDRSEIELKRQIEDSNALIFNNS